MTKCLRNISVVSLLMACQHLSAGNGLLFDVSATGTPTDVNITLCLNGEGPVSCQNYPVSGLALSIQTTVPNHTYPTAGIIVNTQGYKMGNLGVDCIPNKNGYCLFSVSDTEPKTLYISRNTALTVDIQPVNQPINAGQSATLTVTASGGTAPYSYQWYSCTTSACTTVTSIAGETSHTYNPPTATTGTFYYGVIVTDAVHAIATSNVATITVNDALSATVNQQLWL